jgi:hypothetical protein
MSGQFFFGYGSLVNRRTHQHGQASPAHLSGWRRVWRSTTLREVAILSAHRTGSGDILGLVAQVDNGDWQGLDIREAAYHRLEVTGDVRHGEAAASVQVYSMKQTLARTPCTGHILLSYLDTVAEGFHDMAGPAGLQAFFETTDGWTRAVLNDRDRPLYPRATSPGPALRRLVDRHLSQLPVTVQQLEKPQLAGKAALGFRRPVARRDMA